MTKSLTLIFQGIEEEMKKKEESVKIKQCPLVYTQLTQTMD